MSSEQHLLSAHPDPEKAARGWQQCLCGGAPGTDSKGQLVCLNTPGLVTYSAPNGTQPLPTTLLNLTERDEEWMATRAMIRCYAPVATGVVHIEELPGQPKKFGGWLLQCMHAHDGTGVILFLDDHAERVRWYSYGCAHEYRSIPPKECAERGIYHGSRCYHVSECKLCGHVNSVDSSD